jgi:hypothetical protein
MLVPARAERYDGPASSSLAPPHAGTVIARTRLVATALLLTALAACARHRATPPASPAASSAAPSRAGRVTVVDLTPRFLAFFDSASARPSMSADERYAMWRRLYGFAAVPPTPLGQQFARRLLDGAWTRYPAALPRIRRGTLALGVSPDSVLDRVSSLLGCGDSVRVRLVVFVGGFEANAFTGGPPGALPTINIPVEAGDPARAMAHEFTHAVHRSSACAGFGNAYRQSLAELVMSEGVAMRAVEKLSPGHPPTYYTTAAPGWFESAESKRDAILRGVRAHLAEDSVATVERFTFGQGSAGLPREAYYAGWVLVGTLLDEGMSMHEIATMRPEELTALLTRTIDRIVGK